MKHSHVWIKHNAIYLWFQIKISLSKEYSNFHSTGYVELWIILNKSWTLSNNMLSHMIIESNFKFPIHDWHLDMEILSTSYNMESIW